MTSSSITRLISSFVKAILPPPPRSLDGGETAETVVFDFDISGSMASQDIEPSRLEAAKRAASAYIRERRRRNTPDLVSCVVFESAAEILCANVSIRAAGTAFFPILKSVSPRGGTDIASGLLAAESVLSSSPRSVQAKVILLSDGEDGGTAWSEPADRLKQAGVVIYCIGVGGRPEDIDPCLKNIASTVNGVLQYRFIKDADTLANHFQEIAMGLTRIRS